MRVIPTTKHEWLRFVLFPFKAYTAFAYIAFQVWRSYLPPRADYVDAGSSIMAGYLMSFVALWVGASFQKTVGPRQAYLTTGAFIVADFVFIILMLPYLGRT